MNFLKLSFCFGLGLIAYKTLSKNDVIFITKEISKKIKKTSELFKKINNSFLDLICAYDKIENIVDDKEINKKIKELNNNIKKFNNDEISKIKFL